MRRKLNVRCGLLAPGTQERFEYRTYEVEVDGEATVLDVLKIIYREKGAPVAFQSYCRQGLCGGCVVEVNGHRVLSCTTLAQDGMEISPVLSGECLKS